MRPGWLLVVALLLASSAEAQTSRKGSPGPPDQSPSVSSSGQAGGVTAGHVDTINQTNIGSDSRLDSLKSLLTAHSQRARDDALKIRDLPAYLFLIDARDSRLQSASGVPKLYWLFVGPSDLIEREYDGERCHPQDGISMYGMSVYATDIAGSRTLTMQFLTVADPVFSNICETLGESDRREGRPGGRAESSPTHYDRLSLGAFGQTSILLLPSEIDGIPFISGYQRYYWASAFTDFQPVGLSMLPPDFMEFVQNNPSGEELSFQLPAGQGAPFKPSAKAPYPSAIAANMGDRLATMDAKWLDYLDKRSDPAASGRSIWLGSGVRVFSSKEIGRPEFWQSATDLKDFIFDVSCVGSAFLLENNYANGPGAQQSSACMFGRARSR
ncbi:MAG TPA: hypothetical protein VEA44_07825 [Caulobacter sp.]|nr:hypothetical protein [Caulobacter sp.]